MMGQEVSDMDLEFKYGLMAPSIKVNGRITKLMEKVPFGMPMETFTKESFATTNPTDMVSSTAPTEQFTKGFG